MRYPNLFGKQENVLAESRMMIPDCRKRLEAALADLKATVAELDQQDGPEIEEAQTTISQVESLFSTSTTSESEASYIPTASS